MVYDLLEAQLEVFSKILTIQQKLRNIKVIDDHLHLGTLMHNDHKRRNSTKFWFTLWFNSNKDFI